MKALGEIGEDALIERLVELVPQEGIGDDCAVVDLGLPWLQLLKTDALVEGVHYTAEAPPRAVGWKAVARVMSDFAAMGGRPERFLVTLALPKNLPIGWVEDFYRGMGVCLEKFGAVLIGGETSSVPDGSAAVISIAATGRVERENVVWRSGARVGDLVFVTGFLGGSLQGKHLNFMPRVAEAEWLVKHFKPSAMMDVSDGLAKDLPRLARASQVGFRLEKNALPLAPGCSVEQALGDGEDFELLFTLPGENAENLLQEWPRVFPRVSLAVIGEIVPQEESDTLQGGWEHFS